MPGLAKSLIIFINRLTPKTNSVYLESKRDLMAYARFEYSRAPSTTTSFGFSFNLKGKTVLDIGCGLGGSEAYYLELGAKQVYAIDLHLDRLQGASKAIIHLNPTAKGQVLFTCSNAQKMAFPDNHFDLIVSTNTFEHIFGVEAVLSECARVLKSDGLMFISFPPYLSPWGAHLNNWIKFPWCQVFFSEKALVRACRDIEQQQNLRQWIPQELFLDLSEVDYIPHLNRMSINQFEAFVESSPLQIVKKIYLPVGWRSGHPLSRFIRPSNKISYIQDYVTSQAVYILQRIPR